MANPLLDETNVSLNNPIFTDLLNNLQGHILKHHGRTHAYHIFFQFKPNKVLSARKWLKSFAKKVTSTSKQLTDADRRKEEPKFDGGVFQNLSLTHSGYVYLRIDPNQIPSADSPFANGMKASQEKLKDTPQDWDQGFQGTIDAMIIVADDDSSNALAAHDEIIRGISPFSTVAHVQKGKILRNEHGLGIEHFGYVDGISQPNFLATNDSPASQWDDNGAFLSTVLVEEPNSTTPDAFGSYFVFRKLEQNVKEFKKTEKQLPKTKDGQGKDNDELTGALLVGRFEDGTEVVNSGAERGIIKPSQLINDFDYRDDASGLKCPFHSHIRITNPRADVSNDFAKSVRLTRRGIPYNDIGRDEFDLEADQPTGGVGLLFQCYQSKIESQFEFIQDRWSNQGNIGDGERRVGQDAIIGQGGNATLKHLPIQWGLPIPKPHEAFTFGQFVTMKGGEYFFTPSIPFLRNL